MNSMHEAWPSPPQTSMAFLPYCSIPTASAIAVILMTFQQWTGINAINYYSPIIFRELGFKSALAGLMGTGLYGLVKIIMTAIALAVGIEQYGRKAMLVWGGLGQASCMLFIGLYKATHRADDVSWLSYVAVFALYLYIIFFSFGWSVAPWAAMSESVPNHLRSVTMSAGLMSSWLFSFVIGKVTPLLLEEITYWTYILFGGITLLGVLWALFFYPETGGYAIEDIHALFDDVIRQSMHDNRYLISGLPKREANRTSLSRRSSSDSLRSVDRFLDEAE